LLALLFLLASLSFKNSRAVALSPTGAEAGSPLIVVVVCSSLFACLEAEFLARRYLPFWEAEVPFRRYFDVVMLPKILRPELLHGSMNGYWELCWL